MPASSHTSPNASAPALFRRAPGARRVAGAALIVTTALFLAACGGTKARGDATEAAIENAPPPAARPLGADSMPPPSRQTLLDSGRVYFQACAICHGGNGRGGRGPAVANSDYVQGDLTRLIRTVLEGVQEPIRVNGVRWKTGEMLGWADTWDDFKIAAVLTYIRVALNDSTVTSCIPEDFETGTWASCTLVPRSPEEIARDSVAVNEVSRERQKSGKQQ